MTSGGETSVMAQEGVQVSRSSGGDDSSNHDPHHQARVHQQHHQQPYLGAYFPGTSGCT